jgi:hypothetical protein
MKYAYAIGSVIFTGDNCIVFENFMASIVD